MRFRVWRSPQTRVLPLGSDGPLAVHEGDVVVVAVVEDYERAMDVMRALAEPPPADEVKP